MSESKGGSDVYVVTGGSGGIGSACARRFARRGTVLLADICADAVEAVALELSKSGLNAKAVVCDIRDRQAVAALANQAASLGRVRGVAATAGLSTATADWKTVITTNLQGTAFTVDAFLPLAESGTGVVCISSIAAQSEPGDPAIDEVMDDPLNPEFFARADSVMPATTDRRAYSITKRGINRLCERMAPAFAARGARINSVSPGAIWTPMGAAANALSPGLRNMVQRSALRRWGSADEIAAVVDFLCSTEASYITGTDVVVDGGVRAFATHPR